MPLDESGAVVTKRHRWSVLLAGGQGKRLRSFTRNLMGDDRPKQFCRLLGSTSLLSQTRSRLLSVTPADQAIFVLLGDHQPYYEPELAGVDPSRLLVQPSDRGTTPAIALALLRLLQFDSHAVVGFFPTDHYYHDDAHFSAAVELAYEEASAHSGRIVLLGARPDSPDTEYGWIEPGPALSGGKALFSRVARFVEKPRLALAEQLLQQGCLWNTFVMVGRIETFIRILNSTVAPVFQTLSPLINLRDYGAHSLKRFYGALPANDFSRQVLPVATNHLTVMLFDAPWTDLGTPARVFAALQKAGCAPAIGASV
jgi:mannose-1-phosphate guanylyltransferase